LRIGVRYNNNNVYSILDIRVYEMNNNNNKGKGEGGQRPNGTAPRFGFVFE
jgi:hypothetical protein